MKNNEHIKNLAVQTLETEAEAVSNLKHSITDDFAECIHLISSIEGRVIVTGIGKSAIIAQKIVATFNSTGTPSIFMHAADAIHGDLGIIQKDDVVLCISQSGNTPEIKILIPLLRSWGNKLIAMTGHADSYLARQADLCISTAVTREACPNNLAPSSSSAAQMAMGDALAVCLLDLKGFSSKDFAKYHPGGSLGKRLYLKVGDIYPQNAAPSVSPGEDIRKVISEISSNRLGASAVIENGSLIGVITDGDVRRMLLDRKSIEGITARDIMNSNPKTVPADMLAVDALALMKSHNITQLIVTEDKSYKGMVHLHDLLREGIM